MTRIFVGFFLIACGESTPAPSTSASSAAPVPIQTPAPSEAPSPSELYAECGEAVEGPSKQGECTTTADCEAVGCSGEMCVSKATAKTGILSGCMERPCHAVLDTCGCVEGMCSWSLKAAP